MSPISVADFLFTFFCNPPVYPSSVVPSHSAPLRAVHLTRLPLLDSRTSTLVTFRHLDTGYHRSHSPCGSHLNRHVLAATSLVWPATLAHHLVHLGNVIRKTRLLHSTLLVNTEASSNQLLLFADWVVLRTLIVAWMSRHTRVVLLGLASCRALSRLLGQLTEHPAQRLGSDSITSSCPRPCGLVPSTRIVSPCFALPRFQRGLSSRAPQDSTKRTRFNAASTESA